MCVRCTIMPPSARDVISGHTGEEILSEISHRFELVHVGGMPVLSVRLAGAGRENARNGAPS